jgi:hypothetical protein
VWNSCRDQLLYKWNSTEALVFRVEQWNSVLLFLHQLWPTVLVLVLGCWAVGREPVLTVDAAARANGNSLYSLHM